jgi:hypothetical protein
MAAKLFAARLGGGNTGTNTILDQLAFELAVMRSSASCAEAPNGRNAKLAGVQCPLTTITAYADGRVNARTSRPACFLWVDPAGGPGEPDARTNGTYMRYNAQSGAVQVTTVVDGHPQAGCQGSTHA